MTEMLNQHLRLEDIGYFRVTRRGLESYTDIIDLDLNQIPKNGKIIDIGSGVYQELAQDIKTIRPDITVFSVDPSLAIPVEDDKFISSGIKYEIPNKDNNLTRPDESLRRNRRENADINSIAALAPDLPFHDDSVDVVLDNHAAFMYLGEDDKNYHEKYISEILRVLKSGGIGYIYPIVLYSRIFVCDEDELEDSQKRAENLIQLFKDKGVRIESYEAMEAFAKDKETGDIKYRKRLGLKIIKE